MHPLLAQLLGFIPQGYQQTGLSAGASKQVPHPFPLPDTGILHFPQTGMGSDVNAVSPEELMRHLMILRQFRQEGA